MSVMSVPEDTGTADTPSEPSSIDLGDLLTRGFEGDRETGHRPLPYQKVRSLSVYFGVPLLRDHSKRFLSPGDRPSRPSRSATFMSRIIRHESSKVTSHVAS
eukprot:6184343-Pleurochrysis_carterae.AAC.1